MNLSLEIILKRYRRRFLHTTWLGSKFVRGFWDFLAWSAFFALSIPKTSPLRNTHSLFWGLRTNDEGAGHPQGFHALANAGKIEIISPARAQCFGDDGRSLVLDDRRAIECDAVVLATGFQSSWAQIFDGKYRVTSPWSYCHMGLIGGNSVNSGDYGGTWVKPTLAVGIERGEYWQMGLHFVGPS
ncbi:hypothetical protein PHLCEN_2v3300 [Hermanssonia centrifuga]|uniref:Uncharacterized protein n=1 Tax=Hermanssonia centrifuga TaxID=98765 RepID=A0A2R6QM74_9APHY|nr:hypothetical protein PHLCEN_2v3300 [Hermanssonia centrifuga]